MVVVAIFGALALVSVAVGWLIAAFEHRQWPKLPRWAVVMSTALVTGLAAFWVAWPVGEALVVIEGATSPADEAEAGPLVFVALLLFAAASSLVAGVGSGIGALLAFRLPAGK